MGHQSLSHNTVLDGDVLRRSTLVVPVDGEVLVLSPGKGAMVEDHVLAIGNASTVLVLAAHAAHAETHEAHDNVVGTRETDTVAIDGDTLARCCLAGDVEVLGKDDARVDAYHTAHIEHHDAVGLTDGIAQ